MLTLRSKETRVWMIVIATPPRPQSRGEGGLLTKQGQEQLQGGRGRRTGEGEESECRPTDAVASALPGTRRSERVSEWTNGWVSGWVGE
jgi:hypothetical protein